MKKLLKLLYLMLLINLISFQSVFCQEKLSLSIGGFGTLAIPTSDSFKHFIKYGYGGGIIIQADINEKFSPYILWEISVFTEKTDNDFMNDDSDKKLRSLLLGFGCRFYKKVNNFRLFIEPTLTIRNINFYLYEKKGQNEYEVGGSENKIGYAIGGGINFKNITAGIRWMDPRAVNITYLVSYFEFKFPFYNK